MPGWQDESYPPINISPYCPLTSTQPPFGSQLSDIAILLGFWACYPITYPYNALVRTIAVINQKGGVGKTTTVANLGAAIAAMGHKVCLVDLDPQAHLTLHFGVEPGQSETGVYDVLVSDASCQDAIVNVTENISILPSEIDLAAAEIELVTTVGREQILTDKLAKCDGLFDYAMIDCPPSLGLLTLNALAAADDVFIPLQPHFLALQGLGKLLETVALVQKRINPRLKVTGVIMCMHERNTRLAAEVEADMREFFDATKGTDVPWGNTKLLKATIRRNVKLAECPSYGTTIFDYAPGSNGANDYLALAKEFMDCLNATETPPVSTEQTQCEAESLPESQAESDDTCSAADLDAESQADNTAEYLPEDVAGQQTDQTQQTPHPQPTQPQSE